MNYYTLRNGQALLGRYSERLTNGICDRLYSLQGIGSCFVQCQRVCIAEKASVSVLQRRRVPCAMYYSTPPTARYAISKAWMSGLLLPTRKPSPDCASWTCPCPKGPAIPRRP